LILLDRPGMNGWTRALSDHNSPLPMPGGASAQVLAVPDCAQLPGSGWPGYRHMPASTFQHRPPLDRDCRIPTVRRIDPRGKAS